jgi:hypothetical protein
MASKFLKYCLLDEAGAQKDPSEKADSAACLVDEAGGPSDAREAHLSTVIR